MFPDKAMQIRPPFTPLSIAKHKDLIHTPSIIHTLCFECLLFTALQLAAQPRLASNSDVFAVAVKA